jgi:hypothetical protein
VVEQATEPGGGVGEGDAPPGQGRDEGLSLLASELQAIAAAEVSAGRFSAARQGKVGRVFDGLLPVPAAPVAGDHGVLLPGARRTGLISQRDEPSIPPRRGIVSSGIVAFYPPWPGADFESVDQ